MKLFALLLVLTSFSSFADVNLTIVTNKGNIDISLDDVKAPVSTANFLRYVEECFYDGLIFHRVVKGFVIQTGGVFTDLSEKPTHDPIINEAKNGLSNVVGTLGMARTNEWNSATSQFYINTASNTGLDGQYAVFGKVTGGMDVVRAIENVPVHNIGGYRDVPTDPIIIQSIIKK
jgi:peptidyl-prolyl cis-trans isomerase A (cyclophilin A)/peptidyl-prolyl cis-trans isomerase B (cyclophilin B)